MPASELTKRGPHSAPLGAQGEESTAVPFNVCQICLSQIATHSCSNEHWICPECFSKHVQMQALRGVGEMEHTQGLVPCFHAGQGCLELISHQTVAREVSAGVFRQHQQALEAMIEARIVQAQRAVQADAQMDLVRERRNHVIEEIITFKCQSCGAAWVDFDGCVAVKCRHCTHSFCGVCLQDCGADAHHHVLHHCELNTRGELWPKAHERKNANCSVIKRRLNGYLAQLEAQDRVDLLQSVETDLRDVGVGVEQLGGVDEQEQEMHRLVEQCDDARLTSYLVTGISVVGGMYLLYKWVSSESERSRLLHENAALRRQGAAKSGTCSVM